MIFLILKYFYSIHVMFYFFRVFVLLKPDVIDKMGEILKMIINYDFHIMNLKMIKLTVDDIAENCFIKKDIVDKT